MKGAVLRPGWPPAPCQDCCLAWWGDVGRGLPAPRSSLSAGISGVTAMQSQQEGGRLEKWLSKPHTSKLGKELPTEKAILKDKCNLWI